MVSLGLQPSPTIRVYHALVQVHTVQVLVDELDQVVKQITHDQGDVNRGLNLNLGARFRRGYVLTIYCGSCRFALKTLCNEGTYVFHSCRRCWMSGVKAILRFGPCPTLRLQFGEFGSLTTRTSRAGPVMSARLFCSAECTAAYRD